MAKLLEETHKQLANQVEKTFYEKNQKISKEEMFQLKIIVITLENEKRETSEALAKVQKRNLHLEARLTHDKTTYKRLLKETKKKIKQLHQQLMKSQTQQEIILKELKMVKDVIEIENKEGRKHHQKIITKGNVEFDFRNREIKAFINE